MLIEPVTGGASKVLTSSLDKKAKKQMTRNWALLDDGAQILLRDVLPRLDLGTDVMRSIIADERPAKHVFGGGSDALLQSNRCLLASLQHALCRCYALA